MNAFHVCGGILAVWALLVSVLGITRESFPGSAGAERIIGLVSVVLVAAAIASGIITAAGHESEKHEEGEEAAAELVVTR